LLLGTIVGVVALRLIELAVEVLMNTGRKAWSLISFLTRIILYGVVLYTGAKLSYAGLAGAAIGLLLPRVALGIQQMAVPYIRRKTGREEKAVYERSEKTNVLIKQPWWVTYKNGRKYLTHHRIEKYKKVEGN